MLTAEDPPDAAKIEASVHSTERLRAGQRMAFIGAVGETAKALTLDQRSALFGIKLPWEPPRRPPPSLWRCSIYKSETRVRLRTAGSRSLE